MLCASSSLSLLNHNAPLLRGSPARLSMCHSCLFGVDCETIHGQDRSGAPKPASSGSMWYGPKRVLYLSPLSNEPRSYLFGEFHPSGSFFP